MKMGEKLSKKKPRLKPKSVGAPKSKSSSARRSGKTTLGWREWADLPQLGVHKIKVKIDTGARTSALHAKNIVQIEKYGKSWVSFQVILHKTSPRSSFPSHSAELIEYRKVRSSNGKSSNRPVIRTQMLLGNKAFEVELTLVDRSLMGFPMLVGRQALKRRFLVDPAHSYLSEKLNET